MKCLIDNACKYNNLCCNFCKIKSCKDRCTDSVKNCKFFDNEKVNLKDYEEKEKKEKNYE